MRTTRWVARGVLLILLQGSAAAAPAPESPASRHQSPSSSSRSGSREDLDYQLLQAAYLGHTWEVRNALRRGARINARDGNYGLTPLMWAAWRGHLGTVRHLLNRGAAIDLHSSPEVPFLIAVGKREDSMLLSMGAVTALMLAAGGGSGLTVTHLLQHGANVNARSAGGDTALSCAAFRGYLPSVRTLLARGGDLSSQDSAGATPLIRAVLEGHTETVKLMLRHGAPAAALWRGHTAAQLAKLLGYQEMSRMLAAAAAKR